MAPIKQTPKIPFDEAKFAAMAEPFTVRVEKCKGQARTPIAMPQGEDPTVDPGLGWSRENVRGLENWLVTEWSGGGLYDITIVDSLGANMKWAPWFDPTIYPEIVPPTMRTAAQQQPNPQVRQMSAFPNGLPNGLPQWQQMQQPQQFAHPYGYPPPPAQYQMPQPPPIGSSAWPSWRNEAEDRRREDELRQLRDQHARQEREMLDAKHKAELERERAANEARFARQDQGMNELRTMLAQLTQTLTQQQTQKPAGDSSEVAALRAQVEAQRQMHEAQTRDAAMREMMRQQAEATQRQIDTLMRQMEQQALAAREASQNRSDPLVAMVERQSAMNADTLKTMAQENARSLERVQNYIMTPQSMLELAQRQSQGMDAVTDKLSKTFGSVMDMQQRVIENAINLQPNGTSGIDLAREGIDKVTNLVEKYTTTKSAEQRFAMDAQVKVAQAQAQAIAATQGIQPQQPIVHVPPAQQQQLAGPQVRPSNANGAVAPNGVPMNGAKKVIASDKIERFGRTDQEWFGPLLPEVQRLRAGAARFIESLEQKPPRLKPDGEIDGVPPEQAAGAIVQAVGMCMQNNVAVDALTELLFVDRFSDFVHVIVPDSPKVYQEETTKNLIELAQRLTAEAENSEVPPVPPIDEAPPADDEAQPSDEEPNDEADPDDQDQSQDEPPPEPIAPPPIAKAAPPRTVVRRLH